MIIAHYNVLSCSGESRGDAGDAPGHRHTARSKKQSKATTANQVFFKHIVLHYVWQIVTTRSDFWIKMRTKRLATGAHRGSIQRCPN